MREIKFKAKRKDNNEWIEGNYVYEKYSNRHYITKQLGNTHQLIEVISETVCQYTDLSDKNDVEIYENDIVKMYQMNFESEWEDSWGTLHHDYDEVNITMTMDFAYTYLFTGEYLDELEVIRNIYDKEVN